MGDRWIQLSLCQDELPPEAILVGKDYNGDSIYVGRAYHNNELLPAKIIPKKSKAYVLFNGTEYRKCYCEVLCGEFKEKEEKSIYKHSNSVTSTLNYLQKNFHKLFEVSITLNYRWDFVNNGFVPSNAIVGGHTSNNELIYIGRVKYKNSLILGKIIPSLCSIYIAYKEKEYSFQNYEILVKI